LKVGICNQMMLLQVYREWVQSLAVSLYDITSLNMSYMNNSFVGFVLVHKKVQM